MTRYYEDRGSLFNHLNVSGHPRGLRLLEYIKGREGIFSINGRYYGGTALNYTSQCGGRVIHISPFTKSEVWVGEKVDATVDGPYNIPFASGCNGILMVLVDCVPEDIPAFDLWIDNAMRQLREYHGELESSMAKHRGDAYRGRFGDNVQRVVYIIHTANMHRHGEAEEDECEDRECPYCESYVDSDGYCSECDEYTMEEWYCEYRTPPCDEEDYWMTGDRDEDMSSYEDVFDDRYLWDRANEYANGVVQLAFDDGSMEFGLAHSFHINAYGDGKVDIIGNNLTDAVMRAVRRDLSRKPVFMSSNMGSPYGATPHVMADLYLQRELLKKKYGVALVQPEHYATNPNEGDHYIDSLCLVVEDMNLFKEATRG